MTIEALDITDAERFARLRLIRADNIGTVTFWALMERYGDARAAITALPSLAKKSAKRPIVLPSEDAIRREIDATEKLGAHLITAGDDHYPPALAALDGPPPILTVLGNAKVLTRDIIAIVGARNASALGQRFAREIARDLGAANVVVASGLARGIDTAAHKGSIETGTIAVMAGGIDVVYPPDNESLQRDIVANGGAVITEMSFGQQPTAQHFPRRNRIISGVARGVLVVEATLNSGSLITARLAGEQGRDVFAVPGSPLDPRAKGTNSLLRQGAILTESADDVLSALRPLAPPLPRAERKKPVAAIENTDALQTKILAQLGPVPVETDELVRLLGAPTAEVAAALLDLEFAGRVNRHSGQKVSLA